MPPVQLALRTSVSSTSVTVITPGAGCSITSTATVSTTGATGRAAFFTGARLGLAPAFATTFPRAALDSFLALGRAFAPFLFWTFDDCFLRLAMVDPLVGAPQTHDARSQKTTRPESRQPTLRVINRRSRVGHFGGIADIGRKRVTVT